MVFKDRKEGLEGISSIEMPHSKELIIDNLFWDSNGTLIWGAATITSMLLTYFGLPGESVNIISRYFFSGLTLLSGKMLYEFTKATIKDIKEYNRK